VFSLGRDTARYISRLVAWGPAEDISEEIFSENFSIVPKSSAGSEVSRSVIVVLVVVLVLR
jgi:hypothetical protein